MISEFIVQRNDEPTLPFSVAALGFHDAARQCLTWCSDGDHITVELPGVGSQRFLVHKRSEHPRHAEIISLPKVTP